MRENEGAWTDILNFYNKHCSTGKVRSASILVDLESTLFLPKIKKLFIATGTKTNESQKEGSNQTSLLLD